jgi:AcrR family transcriptional regulator
MAISDARSSTDDEGQPPAKVDGRRTFSRAEIKTVALDLFHERGFMSVSVRNIMDQQGLTAGAMYNHFESKEELLYSIILDSVIYIEGYTAQGLSVVTTDHPAARLAALTYAHALMQCNHPQLSRVGVLEMQHLPQRRRLELRKRLRLVRDEYLTNTLQGIESGVFEVEHPEVVVMEFLGMGTKISDWYHQSGRFRPERLAEIHAKLVLRMVGCRSPEEVFDPIKAALVKTVGRP